MPWTTLLNSEFGAEKNRIYLMRLIYIGELCPHENATYSDKCQNGRGHTTALPEVVVLAMASLGEATQV